MSNAIIYFKQGSVTFVSHSSCLASLPGSVYGDVTFNVGGPVWAMDWCPVPGN